MRLNILSNLTMSNIASIFAIIGVVIAISTFTFELNQANKNLSDLSKQTRIRSLQALWQQTEMVNMMLLSEQNEDIRKKLGDTKEDIFAFMFINNMERNFILFRSGVIDEKTWPSYSNNMELILSICFINKLWIRAVHLYDEEFVKYVKEHVKIRTPCYKP